MFHPVSVGEGGWGGEDAVKWNVLVSSVVCRVRTCSICPHLQTAFWCNGTLGRHPKTQRFEYLPENKAPHAQDSRPQTATSPGRSQPQGESLTAGQLWPALSRALLDWFDTHLDDVINDVHRTGILGINTGRTSFCTKVVIDDVIKTGVKPIQQST